MKFLFFLFLVAFFCLEVIRADDDICDDLDNAQLGLEKINKQPEKFLHVFLNNIGKRIHGKKSILLSVLTPIALLVKGIIEVTDSIASYRLPNGDTVFEMFRNAILFALKLFVGQNTSIMRSWTKFVNFIFEAVKRVYRTFKPVLTNILEDLIPQ